MKKLPDRLLLDFISQVWFGSPAAFFESLGQDKQSELLDLFESYKLEPLAYYVLKGHLPEQRELLFQEKYRTASAIALKSRVAFDSLCRLFEEHKIRFAPFKGVDLAARYYPAGALRLFSDWDVLIHPDDCLRALDVLAANGWKNAEKLDLDTGHFHFTAYYKNSFMLEPHKTFNMFDNVPVLEIWEHMTPEAPGRTKHLLSAELNILQLARHAASNEYTHLPFIKLLLDTAVLISREKIDWQKLRNMSQQWHLPYPGDMLSAWDDFFPEKVLEQMDADKIQCEKFRQLFVLLGKLHNAAQSEWEMSCHEHGRMDFVRQRLSLMSPGHIFRKYNCQGWYRWLLLPALLLWDMSVKVCRFVVYCIKPDKKIYNYHQLVHELENNNEQK